MTRSLVRAVTGFGREARLAGRVFVGAMRGLAGFRVGTFVDELGRIATSAAFLIAAATFFTGVVVALQTAVQLGRLGASHLVADIVSVSVVRELAPVFVALLMAGKAGAGLSSELGMVVLSGQSQAMRALSLDIDRELVAPRVVATTVGTVLLTVLGMAMGLLGGLVLATGRLGLSAVHYTNRVVYALEPSRKAVETCHQS